MSFEEAQECCDDGEDWCHCVVRMCLRLGMNEGTRSRSRTI